MCNSREFIQMLYRNRKLIDDTINIHFKSFYNKYSNGTNKKLLEFNLRALLKQKYKEDLNDIQIDSMNPSVDFGIRWETNVVWEVLESVFCSGIIY